MTKKNPDKREQNRAKKIEAEKQSLRYKAADMVRTGYGSYRKIAKVLNRSHQFVCNSVHRLLDKRTVTKRVDGKWKTVTEFAWKEDREALLASKKPGRRPGDCPIS